MSMTTRTTARGFVKQKEKKHIPPLKGCSSGFAVMGHRLSFLPMGNCKKKEKKNFSTNELMSVSIETLIYV